MAGVTLDSGPLIRLENREADMIAFVKAAKRDALHVRVPTLVIAEWWSGDAGQRKDIVDAFRVEDMPAAVAYEVGVTRAKLLRKYGRGSSEMPSLVDIAVVVWAGESKHRVLTTDPDDLARVQSAYGRQVVIRDVRAVE